MDEFWLDWFGHLWMNSGWTGLVTCGCNLVGLVWSLVDAIWLDWFGHLWMNSGWTGWVTLMDEAFVGFIHPQSNGVCSVARFIH